jgi:hypothetical protein
MYILSFSHILPSIFFSLNKHFEYQFIKSKHLKKQLEKTLASSDPVKILSTKASGRETQDGQPEEWTLTGVAGPPTLFGTEAKPIASLVFHVLGISSYETTKYSQNTTVLHMCTHTCSCFNSGFSRAYMTKIWLWDPGSLGDAQTALSGMLRSFLTTMSSCSCLGEQLLSLLMSEVHHFDFLLSQQVFSLKLLYAWSVFPQGSQQRVFPTRLLRGTGK